MLCQIIFIGAGKVERFDLYNFALIFGPILRQDKTFALRLYWILVYVEYAFL